MPRRPRREAESGIHHVMNRGVDHGPIFFADEDRIEFGRGLATVHDELGATVLAYCLMDDHFHLLLRVAPGTLSEVMRRLISVYTRRTNDRVGRDGPLLRGRFHSIPVETDAYLIQATRYIHRNALDLPGIDAPTQYRWSSAAAYARLRPPPRFVDLAPVTALVGPSPAASADLAGGRDAPTLVPRSVADVHLLVEREIEIDDLTHRSGDTSRAGLARTVMVLLAERSLDPATRRLLADALGHASENAALEARRRAHRRLDADPVVSRVLLAIEAQLPARRAV